MPQDQTSANKLPLDVERREREESGRRAGRLIQLYLQNTSRLPRLAAHPANDVIDGSIAVYDRLKPRDSIDAIYCSDIVALQNAIMSLFADAALSRDRDQSLKQAFAGVTALMEAVAARENRIALKGDSRRPEVLNELMRRYGVGLPESD